MADARTLLTELVAIPSPTGKEADVVAALQRHALADGFVVHEDEAGNFIAEAGTGDRVLWFIGHVDTAPGHIPVREVDGALRGRGTVDAKGPLVAGYVAARDHLPEGIRMFVVGCVDEEGHSAGAKALDLPAPHWVVNGEPSGVDGITLGYKGIVRGHATFQSAVVHGGHPDANAADAMHAWWEGVRSRLHAGTGFDRVQARLDSVQTRDDGLEMTVTARWQLRLPPGMEPVDAEAVVNSCVGDVHVEESLPAVVGSRRGPLVAAFSAAIRAAGMTPVPKRKTGTSDLNVIAPRINDAPFIAYGPGDSGLDHAPEEQIALDDVDAAVGVWAGALKSLARRG